MTPMEEILPGIFHWTTFHPRIKQEVSSYFVEPAATVLDPMLAPEGGVEAIRALGPVERIVLTNRHHYRDSADFGVPVLCNEAGLHEFGSDRPVEGFSVGDEVAPGIFAREVGAICPDDTALEIRVGPGALALADGLIHYGGTLMFVPDWLMDEPEQTKEGLRASLRRLCEIDFDAILTAHGDPIPTGAKQALEAFLRV